MKNSIKAFLLLMLCLFPFKQVLATSFDTHLKQLEALPIQSDGRIKPLRVHAKERLKLITGKSKPHDISATETYLRLSLSTLKPDLTNKIQFSIPVKHPLLKTYLGLDEKENSVQLQDVLPKQKEIQKQIGIFESRNDQTQLTKELKSLLLRLQYFGQIQSGQDLRVPQIQTNSPNVQWIPLASFFTQEKSLENILSTTLSLGKSYQKKISDAYLLELTYDSLNLIHWALLFGLAGFLIATLLSYPTHWAALISTCLVFLTEISDIVFRVLISGRAPFTNMYETVLAAGFFGLLTAWILSIKTKKKVFLLAGHLLNISCLFMLIFASTMLDAKIQPLVPVLRNNFWLSTHVTTITASYAVFGLSWILANIYLVRYLFKKNKVLKKIFVMPDSIRHLTSVREIPAQGRNDKEFTLEFSNLCYQCLKIGVVLLSLGIILGAIWADYSWGRFWGWDPKETWSLITLMTYIGILHGRLTKWLPKSRFIPLVAASFMTVLMTWFGVNYILAVGLHSYGFSEGGALFLGLTFLIQMMILIFYFLKESTMKTKQKIKKKVGTSYETFLSS